MLGAGASVSGGIPLASGIIKKILEEFKDKPSIKNLSKEKKSNYYELMSALTAKERRRLFQNYIKEAKVNIAHIYLAQLVKKGYVDYVLTVNFDDLLLRACGLYNYTMPTYDISNINEFTTTTFQKQSIIYLHGQHYGEWLLNAEGELDKVKDRIPLLLNKICHDRTWIIAGYSGEDEVFNSIKNFASFDNELYWVSYLKNKPSEIVRNGLLDVSTKNAHLITGYDADTFFLDLHSKLNLPTPQIIDKPFSFLHSMMNEVTIPEIDKTIDEHKELYRGLSERMDISNKWIDEAITNIQEKDSVEKFKQEIIEAYTKEEFGKNEQSFLIKITKDKFKGAKPELSDFYKVWGNDIFDLAMENKKEMLFKESFEKYKKAIDFNSKNDSAYNRYGNALFRLAIEKQDEQLFRDSFKKYKKSIELNPKDDLAYINYGNALSELAKQNSDEQLFRDSFDKFEKAIDLNPKNEFTYFNYGIALLDLARLNSDEKTYRDSFKQCEKSIELNPKEYLTYINYGNALSGLAKQNSNEQLFRDSFKQYEKSIELNPNKDDLAYYNYGSALSSLAKLISDQSLYKKSLKQLEKAYELGGSPYNLACLYSLLKNKGNAFKYLKETLNKKLKPKEEVVKDEDWEHYLNDQDFKDIIAKY